MAYEFRLPDIGEGVAEGEVVQWFVKVGDTIREDAPLVSVLTDKANVEIPSPRSGRIAAIHAQVGEKVKVGGLLVTIETSGPGPAAAPSGPVPAPAHAPPAALAPAPVPSQAPGPTGSDRVLATPYVRRLAAERGIDLANVRGSGPGGRVMEADLAVPAPARPPAATVFLEKRTLCEPRNRARSAPVAKENRSARKRRGEMSSSAAFTRTKVAPQTTVLRTSAASAQRRFTSRSQRTRDCASAGAGSGRCA